MKIHSCVITYNRVDLTKQALAAYLETVSVPFSLIVVDNASSDGTQEWLQEWVKEGPGREILLLPENKYPGFACNRGWEKAPAGADFFHRLDNDFRLLPGWCEEVHERFAENKNLGQLGLRTDEEEHYAKSNVGGNFVIRKALWDEGHRFDERKWGEYAPGYAECTSFSIGVKRYGYQWARSRRHIIENMATGNRYDPYYIETYSIRGIQI
jgi:glycosyltransferase involved in cell wall biosynthesis